MRLSYDGSIVRHKFQTELPVGSATPEAQSLQPKTIEAYSRTVRRIGDRFDHQIDNLSEQQLTDDFADLVTSHSWSSAKLDLYGLKFYYAHVLRKPWVAPGLIKPQHLPHIVTIEEAKRIRAEAFTGSVARLPGLRFSQPKPHCVLLGEAHGCLILQACLP